MDLNNIWAQVNQLIKKPLNNVEKDLVHQNIEFGNVNNDHINDVINAANNVVMQYQPPKDDPFYRPNIISTLANVGLLVKQVYNEIYPLKVDTYPEQLIKGVLKTYEEIRFARHKELKKKNPNSNDKHAMKGLKFASIVAVILYCTFIFDNTPIPAPMIVKYVNTAIDRKGAMKKRKGKPQMMQKITLSVFETYRTDDKKGIYKYIKKLAPKCYGTNITPDNYVNLVGFQYFKLSQSQVSQAKKLAKESAKYFKSNVQNGTIALVCIMYVMAKNKMLNKMTYKDFGELPEKTLLSHYKTLLEGKGENMHNPFKISSSMP